MTVQEFVEGFYAPPILSKGSSRMSLLWRLIPKDKLFEQGIKEGNLAKVKSAVGRGASVNKRYRIGRTALMLATEHPTILKYLIEKGAHLNTQDEQGSTALHLAVGNELFESTRILLEAGADPTIRDNRGERAYDGMPEGYEGYERILQLFGEDAVRETMQRWEEEERAHQRRRNAMAPNESDRIKLSDAEHKGPLELPAGTENAISYDEIKDGDELVILKGKKDSDSHRFKRKELETWIQQQYNDNKMPTNPLTREPIRTISDITRYTARIVDTKKGGYRRKTRKGRAGRAGRTRRR